MSAMLLERRVRVALAVLLGLGLALRLIAVSLDPPLHPDEYFQYLEPAWWHLTGLGLQPWEFRDGVRSWVLPFYNGSWVALLLQLGVPAGAMIGWLIKAHWAVINVSLVVLAFRGGAGISRRLQHRAEPRRSSSVAGWEGGLLAAAACAVFPVLVSYAGHTLSELPSMLCLVASLVLTGELLEDEAPSAKDGARTAAWIGVLVSLGACLRIAYGPLALVAPLWLLARRRFRLLAVLLAAALLPVILFGLVDALTWGSFASSFMGYLKFNFIDGKASDYGTEPAGWYVGALLRRAGFALPWLVLPALWGLRATWPYLLSGFGLLAYLSTQPHKEERFIIAFWPFLLVAAAGAIGGFLARQRAASVAAGAVAPPREPSAWQRRRPWCAALWLGLVLAGAAAGRLRGSERWVEQQDRLRALAWAGAQPDIMGLIADTPYTGGAFWFGARVPQFMFSSGLVTNRIVSHALVVAGSDDERAALDANFSVIHRVGRYRVLRRR